MHKAAGRAALIGVMLGGGLLYAGISQAQEAGDQDGASRAERAAELVAAAGGPAAGAHLVAFTRDAAAVDPRDDDVAAEPAVAPAPAQTPQPAAQAVQAQPVALTNAAAPNPAGRR
jgi:hypothetical protein